MFHKFSSLLLMAGVQGAFQFGDCPAYSPMPTFERERYQGVWYDVYHDAQIYFQWFNSCVMAEYTILDA